jgi:hypothetical protein
VETLEVTMDIAGWTISIIAILIVAVLAIRWERGEGDDVHREDVHEFMSPSWVAMARREITGALARRDLDVEPFTLSEEFTDPPAHLRSRSDPGSGTIGFWIRVGRGQVDVGGEPAPDADLRIISDYGDAVELARDPDAAAVDPAEAERRLADGRLRIEGDPSQAPPALLQLDIHRLLAGHTA